MTIKKSLKQLYIFVTRKCYVQRIILECSVDVNVIYNLNYDTY